VKPEQVPALANKYFTRQNRTVGRIVPSVSGTAAGAETLLGVPLK